MRIRAFPYVNGGLFADRTEVPAFNKRAKRMLVEAARLDWKEINPDIFGSMIQAVVDTDMQHIVRKVASSSGKLYRRLPNWKGLIEFLKTSLFKCLAKCFRIASTPR